MCVPFLASVESTGERETDRDLARLVFRSAFCLSLPGTAYTFSPDPSFSHLYPRVGFLSRLSLFLIPVPCRRKFAEKKEERGDDCTHIGLEAFQ